MGKYLLSPRGMIILSLALLLSTATLTIVNWPQTPLVGRAGEPHCVSDPGGNLGSLVVDKDTLLCPGYYSLSSISVAADGVTLDCQGADIARLSGGNPFFWLTITNHSRITVRNCSFQGTPAMLIKDSSRILVENVQVTNATANAVEIVRANGITFSQVAITRPADAGLWLFNASDVALHDVTVLFSGTAGIVFDAPFGTYDLRNVYACFDDKERSASWGQGRTFRSVNGGIFSTQNGFNPPHRNVTTFPLHAMSDAYCPPEQYNYSWPACWNLTDPGFYYSHYADTVRLCPGTYLVNEGWDYVNSRTVPQTIDCQGAAITGSPPYAGITIEGASVDPDRIRLGSVTIRNCNISGYSSGLRIRNQYTTDANLPPAPKAFPVTVEANTLVSNQEGISYSKHWRGTNTPSALGIVRNTFTNNTLGMNVSADAYLDGNAFEGNGMDIWTAQGQPGERCGNAFCAPSESCTSCPADCGPCNATNRTATGNATCNSEICANGKDDDCDGKADCLDPDCSTAEACLSDIAVCGDGICDVGETLTTCPADCQDEGNISSDCIPLPEVCNNRIDDDCDGKTDTRDPDCRTNTTNATNTTRPPSNVTASNMTASNNTRTIKLPFAAGSIAVSSRDIAAESVTADPTAPAGTFFAFTLRSSGTANATVILANAQPFDVYKHDAGWAKVTVQGSSGIFTLGSLSSGDYVLVARQAQAPPPPPATPPTAPPASPPATPKEPADTAASPAEESPQGSFPFLYAIAFAVLLAALLVFLFRGRIFPPQDSAQHDSTRHDSAQHVTSREGMDGTGPANTPPARPAQKSPLVQKFEAKEILKRQVSRGRDMSDVKLEMIKQGWDPKVIEAAGQELKKAS